MPRKSRTAVDTDTGTNASEPTRTANVQRSLAASGQSAAVEDYAKALYALEEADTSPVSSGALAARLGVSGASASNMVRRLAALGFVDVVPHQGVTLTASGRRLALSVLRRHRLLEAYLLERLRLPWEEVHAEAEVLEHALSASLTERIWHELGCPTHDPSGDPIPPAEAERMGVSPSEPLSGLPVGAHGRLVRVSEVNPDALRYLAERGIRPGLGLEVLSREPFGAGQRVRFEGSEELLGPELGRLLFVEQTA